MVSGSAAEHTLWCHSEKQLCGTINIGGYAPAKSNITKLVFLCLISFIVVLLPTPFKDKLDGMHNLYHLCPFDLKQILSVLEPNKSNPCNSPYLWGVSVTSVLIHKTWPMQECYNASISLQNLFATVAFFWPLSEANFHSCIFLDSYMFPPFFFFFYCGGEE